MDDNLAQLDELARMKKRFQLAEEAEHENRQAALEALRFYWGDQWIDQIAQQRREDGRPCFTLNKLPSIVQQVLNDTLENLPAAQINPVGEGADEDTAEAEQGLVRHVDSNGEGSDVAVGWAFLYLVVCGFGSWRINHDYLPMSFDQDLFLERIENPFSVLWDPACKKLDKSDARYCFVVHNLSADEFKEEYPDSELCGLNDFSGLGDQAPGWITRDGCRVVEYFTVDEEATQLVKLADGKTAYEDEIPKGARIAKSKGEPVTRPAQRRRVYRRMSNGYEWLGEKTLEPVDEIPIVTVVGDELNIDGEVKRKGMVHDLIEPSRLFNYNSSAIAETMALGSKAQWLATAEQIEPYRAIWKQANSRNIAVLPYKAVPGQNPPEKIATEPPIQAMSAARLQSADDLRSISGVYDATQAPNGGEESGRAIIARRRQAAKGTAHYRKNLARGIKRSTQILMKYFRVVYDTPRVMRIIGSDLQPKSILVHTGPDNAPQAPPAPELNVKGVFDLSAGYYDVTVSVEAVGQETKRQEAVETLLALATAEPAIVPIIGDLIVDQMDFAGKRAVVDRMRKALPPQLQDGNPTDPNQLAAHNQQLMQQNQQLMQQVQQITQTLQTKQVESQARLQVENLKLQSAEVRANASLEQERIKAQAALITHAADKQFDAVHDHAMAHRGFVHGVMGDALNATHSMTTAEHAQAIAPPAPPAEPLPQAA